MLEKLMNNSYAWAILSILTIVSFVYAIVTQRINKEKRMFSYAQRSYSLIKSKKSNFGKLSVTYDGQPIENFCVSEYIVWNSGNRTINSGDMVASKEITFRTNDENKILDAEIINVSEKTNGFEIKNQEEQSLQILFDYVDKKEGFVVQIMHTGSMEDISIECKIKGGLPIKNVVNDSAPKLFATIMNSKAFFGVSTVFLGVFLIFIFLAAIVFTVGIFYTPLQNIIEPGGSNATIVGSAISLWICLLFLVLIYFPTIKKVYGVGVPKTLKKGASF